MLSAAWLLLLTICPVSAPEQQQQQRQQQQQQRQQQQQQWWQAANATTASWQMFQHHATVPRWTAGGGNASGQQFVLHSGQLDPALLQLHEMVARHGQRSEEAASVEDEAVDEEEVVVKDEEEEEADHGRRRTGKRRPEELLEDDGSDAEELAATKTAVIHELLEEHAEKIHRVRRSLRRLSHSVEFGADLADELHHVERRLRRRAPTTPAEKDELWQELVGAEPAPDWEYYEHQHGGGQSSPPPPPPDPREREDALKELGDFVAEQHGAGSGDMSPAEAAAVRRFASRVAEVHDGLSALRDAAARTLPRDLGRRAETLAKLLEPEAHAWRLDGARLRETLRSAKEMARSTRAAQAEIEQLHDSLLQAAQQDAG